MVYFRYLFPLIFLYACHTGSQIRNFILSSEQSVRIGWYPYYFRLLSEREIKDKNITPLIREGEKHRPLLEQQLKKQLGVSLPEPIKYNYTGYDSINQRVIIRYFACNPEPRQIAGWQVQVVYKLPYLLLEDIYLGEVPLEQ